MPMNRQSSAASAVTPEEARQIAAEAFLYFYPLVSMDVTRRVTTNVPAGQSQMYGPANAFSNLQAFPTADFRAVVRPNFDTLYSSGWVDLTQGPVILTVPDTHGPLLPDADARYVVERVRGARQADERHRGGEFRHRSAGLDRLASREHRAHPGADAVCLDHRAHADQRPRRLRRRSQDPGRLPADEARRLGQAAGRPGREDRPDGRHEDAAESAGRYDARRRLFPLRRRPLEGEPASGDRLVAAQAPRADRHRARQAVEHRLAAAGDSRRRRAGPRRRAENHVRAGGRASLRSSTAGR